MISKRNLRASFVVTVASTALVHIGCSSTVVSGPDVTDGQVQGDADSQDVLLRPDLSNPPAPDVPGLCPLSEPLSGSACDATLSRTCPYGNCAGSHTTEARCVGGRWELLLLINTCNPPPPEPCPLTLPTMGARCTYAGPGCSYGTCPPSNTSFATCDSGRWTIGIASCNPPPLSGDAGVSNDL
jgi:hypothetical protein